MTHLHPQNNRRFSAHGRRWRFIRSRLRSWLCAENRAKNGRPLSAPAAGDTMQPAKVGPQPGGNHQAEAPPYPPPQRASKPRSRRQLSSCPYREQLGEQFQPVVLLGRMEVVGIEPLRIAWQSLPERRSSNVPRQPDSSNTRLIISAETPKSEMINVGRFIAMASRAAVDDTVTKPREVRSASCIEPPTKVTASAATRRCATRSSMISG